MSTYTIYVTGKAKWARVFESQMDTKYGEKFHITVYPDEASLINLKTSGSRLEIKEDEEGKFVKFSRDNRRTFKEREEVLGPPRVVHKVEDKYPPFDKIIGNGSTVTCRLSIYDSSKGKGTRLEAVCVDEHIPYEGSDNGELPF